MFCEWAIIGNLETYFFLKSLWTSPGALKIYQMIPSYCDSSWRIVFAKGSLSMSILVNHVLSHLWKGMR